MTGRTRMPATRRALPGIFLALLMALLVASPPAAATPVAPSAPGSSALGPEHHEDLRTVRDLPRTSTPRPHRLASSATPAAPVRLARWAGTGPVSTPAEALPLPFDLLPVNRN